MRSALRWLCLVAPVVATFGCGGGGGGGSSGAAGALCDEMISCERLPSAARSTCVRQLGIYVPDPQAAEECINGKGLTCEDVSNDTALTAVMTACVYDTSKFACKSNTTLSMCSPDTQGHPSACKDLDCGSACRSLYGVSGTCGYYSPDGWYKCLCGM